MGHIKRKQKKEQTKQLRAENSVISDSAFMEKDLKTWKGILRQCNIINAFRLWKECVDTFWSILIKGCQILMFVSVCFNFASFDKLRN